MSGRISPQSRITQLPWPELVAAMDRDGFTVIENLLSAAQCRDTIQFYEQDLFRKKIIMEHKSYGRGEYQYFDYPLPQLVDSLRNNLYGHLHELANGWSEAFDNGAHYPATLEEFISRCHEAGQQRPTPLMLKYGPGDFNCLHQDLYGDLAFPIQVAILLSEPQKDFEGGEFVLTEQRPRKQSRAQVVPLRQGDAVMFAVSQRPEPGKRGYRRVNMRHGVSTVRSGNRYTLGIIFHDAA